MRQIIITLLSIGLLALNGCVVSKPNASYTSSADYNQRITVRDAHYQTKTSMLGHVSIGLGVAGGAYLGYQMQNGIVRQDGEIRKPIRPANAAIGALAGFATTNLIIYLMGKNKKTSATSADQWLRAANRNFIVYQKQSEISFTAIPRGADQNFLVKNFDDTKGFYRTFPSSSYKDLVFQNSINVIQRSEIPELINIQPNSRYIADAQIRYYESSTKIDELLEAQQRFGNVKYPVEKHAAELTFSIQDVMKFRSKFGQSSVYSDYVFEKIYPSLSLTDINTLVGYYPNAKKVKDAKHFAIEKCKDMSDFGLIKGFGNDFSNEIEERAIQIVLEDRSESPKRLEEFLAIFPKSSKLHRSDNSTYLGGWDLSKKLPKGSGIRMTKTSSDWITCEVGEFKNGKLSGTNCFYSDPIRIYSGEVENGKFKGSGTLKYKDGSNVYIGQFRDGTFNGHGKLCGERAVEYFPIAQNYIRNACYEGPWVNGKPYGQGKLESDDGEFWYKGSFIDGMFGGEGELRLQVSKDIFVPGIRVEGPWYNGKPDGSMAVRTWTLIGTIKAEETEEAHSWEELVPVIEKVDAKFKNYLKKQQANDKKQLAMCYRIKEEKAGLTDIFLDLVKKYTLTCTKNRQESSFELNAKGEYRFLFTFKNNKVFYNYSEAIKFALQETECNCN